MFRNFVARGFTLIEVIVVIALTVVLILVGTGLFIANDRFYRNQKGEIMSVNATREAADRVNEYGRGASAVVGSKTFGGTLYTTGATLVIFQLPAIDSAGNLLAGLSDYVLFGQDPANTSRLLLMVDGAAGSRRLTRTLEVTDKLSAISITYDNVDPALARQASYTLTVTDTGRYAASEQVTGTATLRN